MGMGLGSISPYIGSSVYAGRNSQHGGEENTVAGQKTQASGVASGNTDMRNRFVMQGQAIGATGQGRVADKSRQDEDQRRAADGGKSTDSKKAGNGEALSEEESRRVDELAARDREVRAHEMAHMTAGAGLVLSGPGYTMETGPDGKRYAVGGEVQIDTSPADMPEDTVNKARQIIAAAMAPAEPSAQDQQVAAQARQMLSEAQMEVSRQYAEENRIRAQGVQAADSEPDLSSGTGSGGDTAAVPSFADGLAVGGMNYHARQGLRQFQAIAFQPEAPGSINVFV